MRLTRLWFPCSWCCLERLMSAVVSRCSSQTQSQFLPIRRLPPYLQLQNPCSFSAFSRLLFAFIRQIELTRGKTHTEARDLSAQERYSNLCGRAMTCYTGYIRPGCGIAHFILARDRHRTIIHKLWIPIMFMMVPPIQESSWIRSSSKLYRPRSNELGGKDTIPVRR